MNHTSERPTDEWFYLKENPHTAPTTYDTLKIRPKQVVKEVNGNKAAKDLCLDDKAKMKRPGFGQSAVRPGDIRIQQRGFVTYNPAPSHYEPREMNGKII